MATKPKISGSATTSKPMKPKTVKAKGTPVRTSAGVTSGSTGARNVNPLYRAVRGVASYLGGAAREIRDIPTAMAAAITEEGTEGSLQQQIREAAAAITAGQKGTTVPHRRATGEWTFRTKRK